MSISTGHVSTSLREDIHAPLIPKGRLLPFLVVTGLFFLWAIPNNLNDILIKQFMKSFAMNRSSAAQVQMAFYLGYFLFAIPAGQLMRKVGYKTGIVTGLILLGAGCLMFWPAANAGSYSLFLAAEFVIASGLSFLETAANPFIAQLGPSGSSERRLNLSQAFNPLGSITAVLMGTLFIFSGVELTSLQTAQMQAAGTYAHYLHTETMRVVNPYLILGAAALAWAAMVLVTKFPAVGVEDVPRDSVESLGEVSLWEWHFISAVLTQFLYVGAQVGTWSYFIPYVEGATGVGEKTAGFMLTATLAAFAIGRFTSAWLMTHFPARVLLGVYAVVNVVLGLAAVTQANWFGAGCLLTTSLFMSMMFPTIFALGLKGMGTRTKTAGSLMVMAILGGALLTKLMGILADARGLQSAYLVPVGCFACVAIYAWLWAERRVKA